MRAEVNLLPDNAQSLRPASVPGLILPAYKALQRVLRSKILANRALAIESLREKNFCWKSGSDSGLEKEPEKGLFWQPIMTGPPAQLDELVVGTTELAGVLDVSTNYIQDLTRRGVLEPLRKSNGAAVRGRYALVATVQAFSGISVRRKASLVVVRHRKPLCRLLA